MTPHKSWKPRVFSTACRQLHRLDSVFYGQINCSELFLSAVTMTDVLFQTTQLVWECSRQLGWSESISQQSCLCILGNCQDWCTWTDSGNFWSLWVVFFLKEFLWRMECFTLLSSILCFNQLSYQMECFISEDTAIQYHRAAPMTIFT